MKTLNTVSFSSKKYECRGTQKMYVDEFGNLEHKYSGHSTWVVFEIDGGHIRHVWTSSDSDSQKLTKKMAKENLRRWVVDVKLWGGKFK